MKSYQVLTKIYFDQKYYSNLVMTSDLFSDSEVYTSGWP